MDDIERSIICIISYSFYIIPFTAVFKTAFGTIVGQ